MSVNLILMCGIAVSSSPAACSFLCFWLTSLRKHPFVLALRRWGLQVSGESQTSCARLVSSTIRTLTQQRRATKEIGDVCTQASWQPTRRDRLSLSLVSIWSSWSSQSSQKMFRRSGRSYGNATQTIANDPDDWDDLDRLDRVEFYPDDRDDHVNFEAIIWKRSQTTETIGTIEGYPRSHHFCSSNRE